MAQFDVDKMIAEFDENQPSNEKEEEVWDRKEYLFNDSAPTAALVMLHDCGDSGPGLQGLLAHLWGDNETSDFEEAMAKLGFAVVFPTAPKRIRYQQEIHSWMDRDDVDWVSEENVEAGHESVSLIDSLIEGITSKWNIPPTRIVLGGLGTGGAASLYYSLKGRETKLGGLLVVNSFLPTKSCIWNKEELNVIWHKARQDDEDDDPSLQFAQMNEFGSDRQHVEIPLEPEADSEEDSDEINSLSEDTETDESDDNDDDDDDEEYERRIVEKQRRAEMAKQRRLVREERMQIRKEKREMKRELRKLNLDAASLRRSEVNALKKESISHRVELEKEHQMKQQALEEITDQKASLWEAVYMGEPLSNKTVNKTEVENEVLDGTPQNTEVMHTCMTLFLHGIDNSNIPLEWGVKTAHALSKTSDNRFETSAKNSYVVNCLSLEGGHEINTIMVKYILSWLREVIKAQKAFTETEKLAASSPPPSSENPSENELNNRDLCDDQMVQNQRGQWGDEKHPLIESDPFKLPFVIHPASSSTSSAVSPKLSAIQQEFKIVFQVPVGWEAPLSRYPVSACESSFILTPNSEVEGVLETVVVSTEPKKTAEAIRLRLLQRLDDPNPPGISDCRPS